MRRSSSSTLVVLSPVGSVSRAVTNHIISPFVSWAGFLEIPRSVNIPPITEAQAEALDTIHFLATKYALGLNFKKGDIQFINNLALFHGRDGFRDDPEHP